MFWSQKWLKNYSIDDNICWKLFAKKTGNLFILCFPAANYFVVISCPLLTRHLLCFCDCSGRNPANRFPCRFLSYFSLWYLLWCKSSRKKSVEKSDILLLSRNMKSSPTLFQLRASTFSLSHQVPLVCPENISIGKSRSTI